MFGRRKTPTPTHSSEYSGNLAADICIYAIGDIHGRRDLLLKMHSLIEADMLSKPHKRKLVIYLGDYVDRGPQSKEVIDALVTHKFEGAEHMYLMGNHEFAMLNFISVPDLSDAWLAWGGDSTLASYGVLMVDEAGNKRTTKEVGNALAATIPEDHLAFLNSLKLYHQEGNFLFVHAGVRPGIPLTSQSPNDMMMIRDEFIFSTKLPSQIVVFGHTIFDRPFLGPMRIGVDTGAYYSNTLTCAVITSDSLTFLET